MAEFRCPMCAGAVPIPVDPSISSTTCPNPDCRLRIPRAKWPVAAPAEPAEPNLVFPPSLQAGERTMEVDQPKPSGRPLIRVRRSASGGSAPGPAQGEPPPPDRKAPPPVPPTPPSARAERADGREKTGPEPVAPERSAEPAVILQALVSVVALHEGVKSAELAILQEHAQALKTKLRRSQLRAYSLDRIAEQIRDREQRRHVLAEMVRIAKADGDLNEEETGLIQHLALRWGIPAPGIEPALQAPPHKVKRITEEKIRMLAREEAVADGGAANLLEGVVEGDPPLPLDRLPWFVVAMGAGSVAGAIFAWMLKAVMPSGALPGFFQTIVLLLCLATLAGGTALILYFRYGPRPSREGARRASWGTNAACAAFVLLLFQMVK